MFKAVPTTKGVGDYAAYIIARMDAHNIAIALTAVEDGSPVLDAAKRFPGRFALDVGPVCHARMDEVRKIERLHGEIGFKRMSVCPCGLDSQVASAVSKNTADRGGDPG